MHHALAANAVVGAPHQAGQTGAEGGIEPLNLKTRRKPEIEVREAICGRSDVFRAGVGLVGRPSARKSTLRRSSGGIFLPVSGGLSKESQVEHGSG